MEWQLQLAELFYLSGNLDHAVTVNGVNRNKMQKQDNFVERIFLPF